MDGASTEPAVAGRRRLESDMRAAGERFVRPVLDLAKAKWHWMAKDVHGGSGGSPYVRSEVLGHVRGIVLDRPSSRNAVDLAMVSAIADMLHDWESNTHVEAVLVRGEGGRAFCAGGDVKKVAEAARKGDLSVGEDFFRGIYSLVYQIANYEKPYMSLLDGVVMGGGGGISMHGPVRIATENAVFAMPEATIGFFPDVGASFFLHELPGLLGRYLALTGTTMKGKQLLHAGIATHFIPSKKVPTFLEFLHSFRLKAGLPPKDALFQALDRFRSEESVDSGAGMEVKHLLELVNRHFVHSTVERIMEDLRKGYETAGKEEEAKWYEETLEKLNNNSPLSLKVILRQFQEAHKIMQSAQQPRSALIDCLRMECRMMQRFMNQEDFLIGVQSVLVEKKKKPMWKYGSLDQVSDDLVDSFFRPMPGDQELCGLVHPMEGDGQRVYPMSKL